AGTNPVATNCPASAAVVLISSPGIPATVIVTALSGRHPAPLKTAIPPTVAPPLASKTGSSGSGGPGSVTRSGSVWTRSSPLGPAQLARTSCRPGAVLTG